MLKLLLPILLAVVGVAAGAAAGMLLRPDAPVEITEGANDCPTLEADTVAYTEPEPSASEYVKLNNQFVIPVIEEGRIAAMVIASLSVEVAAGQKAVVYEHEPKLRDAFNEVFFLHANAGGFSGVFTDTAPMNRLQLSLTEVTQTLLGSTVKGVLVDSIMRQDN